MSVGGWITGLRYVNNGIIVSGQGKEKGGQKNHKHLYGVRIKRTVRKENVLDPLDLMSWEEAVYLDIGYFSS